MRRIFFTVLTISIAVGLIFLPGRLPALSTKAYALSIEEEEELGREFLVKIREHLELLEDDFEHDFINQLGRQFVDSLPTAPFAFRFHIVKNNTLNAFAAPGGHIFVFTGLINMLDNADELAAVISHEIAHVTGRHLAMRIERSQKIALGTLAGILAGALIGGDLAKAVMTGSVAAGRQAQLRYSREDERQADLLGFKYMSAVGFDPGAMLSILKKIETGNWVGPDKTPAYLLTHPGGPERMSHLDRLLEDHTFTPQKGDHPPRTDFSFFKAAVRAKSLDPSTAANFFEKQLQKDPANASTHFGLGILYKEKADFAQAIEHLAIARQSKPGLVPILSNLGEAYQRNGQSSQAEKVLTDAREQDRTNRQVLFNLGLAYTSLERYTEATQVFEHLASYGSVREEIYYHLGMVYGRQDRLARAHYNLGLYFQKLGKSRKSEFHFRKALNWVDDDPELSKKIQAAAAARSKAPPSRP